MTSEICEIQFCTLSADYWRRSSVVEVTSHDIYEKGVPKFGGLNDLRMGTIDRGYLCQSCKGDVMHCSGHFGHIELAKPVFHIGFMKLCHKILQTICLSCKNALCNYELHNLPVSSIKRFKNIHELCKNKMKCPHCSEEQSKVSFENWKIQLNDEVLSAEAVSEIFSSLSEKVVNFLGFDTTLSHPKNLIFSVFPVCPPQVRPCVLMDASLRSQDDLTHKLSEIVKANNSLLKTINTPSTPKQQLLLEEQHNLLQFHITTYIDNGIPGLPQATQRTGRPIKALTQRLKTKEGRVRGNLMGKRVNHSARTVITAEPNIDLDELGVPWEIATNMTYPETVTDFNKNKLQILVNNGYYPSEGKTGVKTVQCNDITKDLRFIKKLDLNVGDIVERHLMDGDLVVFNRQPSLHKMSMMGHKIKVMSGSTFRMNLSACNPYNADFDGDEMNMHVPQTYLTKSEVKDLMMVGKNIISPQSNKPVIGIVQDALLGCFMSTQDNVFVTRENMMQIAMAVKRKHCSLPYTSTNCYTGRQMLDMILPNINYSRGNVKILNGVILSGTLCKRVMGTSEGSLIHQIWLEFGHDVCKNFISDVQYIMHAWLIQTGFSIGADDIFTDKKSAERVKTSINNAKSKVNQLIGLSRDVQHNEIFENEINQVLNNAMALSGRAVLDTISPDNNINITVSGGSKGSINNISQIMACVGQQNVGGKRVALGYKGRVLPHFEENDISPSAKGFVENSYFDGLKPHEFFYHAMGGREGIIDTAIKTSETGYIQRRLVKSMEDLVVQYDSTVRNSIGDVVQFVYGDDGFDATYLLTQSLSRFNKDDYYYKNIPDGELEFIENHSYDVKHTTFKSPIHFSYLFGSSTNTAPSNIVDPQYVFDKVKTIIDSIIVNNESPFNNTSHTYIRAQIVQQLSSNHITQNLQLDKLSFDNICNSVIKMYRRSKAQNGENVGTVAAQSLGEVTTQLTLNTFHSAGISAKNVTLGVPRLKEIINVAKNIKSPSMTLFPKEQDTTAIEKLSIELESNTILDVMDNLEIIENISSIEHMNFYIKNCDCEFINRIVRVHINKSKLLNKCISLFSLCVEINKTYDFISPIFTSEQDLFIDFCFVANESTQNFDDKDLKLCVMKVVHSCNMGYKDIERVYISKTPDNCFLETKGVCFKNILLDQRFEHSLTTSNNILEIRDVLGIEAARNVILQEIRKVIEFDGSYVNLRHFLCLVDTMTYRGEIMAITRHGINRTDTGPLMKCSFEETVDVLIDAATFAECDLLKGVTENVTVGKMAKIGTGTIDILQTFELSEASEHNIDYFSDTEVSDSEYSNSFIPDETDLYLKSWIPQIKM